MTMPTKKTGHATVAAKKARSGTQGDPGPSGRTTPVLAGEMAPRLPHEHDESTSSQHSEPREVMKQAYRDVENKLMDTDRAAPMDELYHRTLRSEGDHSGIAKPTSTRSGVSERPRKP